MNKDRFKFRVWDETRKKYWGKEEWDEKTKRYYDDNYVYLGTDGRLREYHFGDVCLFDKPGQIVEQCTGLKDKNGNLIYEGDIIHEVDKEAGIDDISQIVWNQGTCHFMKLDLPETGLDRHCILCEDDSLYIEIIGNIHEQKDNK